MPGILISWLVLLIAPLLATHVLRWSAERRGTRPQIPASAYRLRLLTMAASALVGIVPLAVLELQFGVSRKITLAYGFIAYVLGTAAVKVPVYNFAVVPLLQPRLSHRWMAVVHGLVSAGSERRGGSRIAAS